MAVLKRLGDFNDVLKCYKNMLHWSKNMFSRREEFEADYPIMDVPFYRFLINNAGVSIAQNFDYIEKNIDDSVDIDNAILEVIDRFGKNNRFKIDFEKIMKDNKLTPFETLKSIRNSLLHGDYELEFERNTVRDYAFVKKLPSLSENTDGIVMLGTGTNILINDEKLDGRKVHGKIDMDYITSTALEVVYETIRKEKTAKDSILCQCGKDNYASCKNRFILNRYLETLKYLKISAKRSSFKGNREDIIEELKKTYVKSKNNVDTAIRHIRAQMINLETTTGKNGFEIEEISEEDLNRRKTRFKEYVEYVGFDRMEQLTQQPTIICNAVIDEVLGYLNGDVGIASVANLFAVNIQKYASKRLNENISGGKQNAFKFDDKFDKNLLIVHLYEAPLVYTSILLGMINYACVFLKENNDNNGMSLFEYYNMPGFNSVKLIHDNTGSIKTNVDSTEKKDALDKQIAMRTKQMSNLEADLEDLKKRITDKNPKKHIFEEKREDKSKKLDRAKHIISILESRKAKYGETYDDYTEFFRHIRNSIAHGRYTVDFSKAFKKRDFSKINFTFRDYNEKNNSITVDFEVVLTAGQIMQIIQGVMDKVNEQLQVEGELDIIEATDFFDDIMSEDEFREFQEKLRAKPSDLKEQGFITEEDQISSFEMSENIQTKEGAITVND